MAQDAVLDTSVVIKQVRQGEVLSDRALALRERYLRGELALWAPTLLAYELANVLGCKQGLSSGDAQRAVQSLFDIGIALVPPSGDLMRRTIAIAGAFDITAHDAAFAALAESLQGTFITADQRLAAHLTALRYVRFLGD